MFDFGWSELLIIAVVMIIVIGPKDLPRVLRGLGRAMGAVRRTAADFRAQFEDAVRESELDELRRDFQDVGSIDPMASVQGAIEDALEPARAPAAPVESAPLKKTSAKKPAAKKTPARKPRRAAASKAPAKRRAGTKSPASKKRGQRAKTKKGT